MRHLYSEASKCVIGPAPLLPARMLVQVVSTSAPKGVTSPRPVTTTRRIILSPKPRKAQPCGLSLPSPSAAGGTVRKRGERALALVLFDVLVGVADGVDLLRGV